MPELTERLCTGSYLGDVEGVELLLSLGADPNETDHKGNHALNYAAGAGHATVVQRLIAAGADINRTNTDTRTPLMSAASSGHRFVVTVLLAAGADPNIVGRTGTALHLAAAKGCDIIVRQLLDVGANAQALSPDGVSTLHSCARTTTTTIAEMLLAAGADINAMEWHERATPLDWARVNRNEGLAQFLRSRGALLGEEIDRPRARSGRGCLLPVGLGLTCLLVCCVVTYLR
jgi:ankyrin repeat protein